MWRNWSVRTKVLFLACLGTISTGIAMSESPHQPVKLSGPTQADADRVLASKCVDLAKSGLHDPSGAELPDPLSHFDYPSKFYVGEHKKGITTVQFEMRAKNGFNALRMFTVDCQWKKAQDGYTLAKFDHWQSQ